MHITDITAWCNIDFYEAYSNPLYYAKNLYLNGELVTDLIIPNGVTTIKSYTFRSCGTTNITIPDSVTTIGEYTFSGCLNLTSIIIPTSVTRIGKGAFSYCPKLTIKSNKDNKYVKHYCSLNNINWERI